MTLLVMNIDEELQLISFSSLRKVECITKMVN